MTAFFAVVGDNQSCDKYVFSDYARNDNYVCPKIQVALIIINWVVNIFTSGVDLVGLEILW